MDENEITELDETAADLNAATIDETSDIENETAAKKSGFSHTIRHKDGGTITIKNYSIFKAVKLNCSECCGFESNPRECIDKLCPLWPFRDYTIANRTRAKYATPTPEQIKKLKEGLAKARAAKNAAANQREVLNNG